MSLSKKSAETLLCARLFYTMFLRGYFVYPGGGN